MREDWTSFDLVIKDTKELLCFLHFIHRHVYIHEEKAEEVAFELKPPAFMSIYKLLKFKMKLSYE